MASRIFYYNLTYYCNNNCRFCFSHSTGLNKRSIDYSALQNALLSSLPTADDMIVLNGGEPTLHPHFYEFLEYLNANYDSNVRIYSNGRKIAVNKLSIDRKNTFVIPVHGDRALHDAMTQVPRSYSETLDTLREMEYMKIGYSIKIIVTPELLQQDFDILAFLLQNKLHPKEVFIARLNATKKSKINGCRLVPIKDLEKWIGRQFFIIGSSFKIKTLDIPPCCLDREFHFDSVAACPVPVFFFNDDRICMSPRIYVKDIRPAGERFDCDQCRNKYICQIISESYLTLSRIDGRWVLEVE